MPITGPVIVKGEALALKAAEIFSQKPKYVATSITNLDNTTFQKKMLLVSSLIGSDTGKVYKKSDGTVLENCSVHSSNGVEIAIGGSLTENYAPEKLERLAKVMATMNLLLDDTFKIKGIIAEPEWVKLDSNGDTLMYESPWAKCEPPYIRMTTGMFNYSADEMEKIVWHEMAHAFQKQIQKTMPDLWAKFEALYDRIKDGSVPSLFEESTYMGHFGHANSFAVELFASAADVLPHFPQKFLDKRSELKKDDKTDADEVAIFVVSRYMERPNCPKDLFDYRILKTIGFSKY